MVEKKDPHEAQWRKISANSLETYKVTGKNEFKARHEACERLLIRYC
jgi:hypothetical protein